MRQDRDSNLSRQGNQGVNIIKAQQILLNIKHLCEISPFFSDFASCWTPRGLDKSHLCFEWLVVANPGSAGDSRCAWPAGWLRLGHHFLTHTTDFLQGKSMDEKEMSLKKEREQRGETHHKQESLDLGETQRHREFTCQSYQLTHHTLQ